MNTKGKDKETLGIGKTPKEEEKKRRAFLESWGSKYLEEAGFDTNGHPLKEKKRKESSF